MVLCVVGRYLSSCPLKGGGWEGQNLSGKIPLKKKENRLSKPPYCFNNLTSACYLVGLSAKGLIYGGAYMRRNTVCGN